MVFCGFGGAVKQTDSSRDIYRPSSPGKISAITNLKNNISAANLEWYRMKIILTLSSLVALCFLFIVAPRVNKASAYDNVYSHPDINQSSLKKFTRDVSFDIFRKKYKKFKRYNFTSDSYKMEGVDIWKSATFEVEIWMRSRNYQKWIERGGYSADEPELYSSLRHFYDPLKLQVDKHTHQHVSYLTDHASEFLEQVNDFGNFLTGKFIVDPRTDAREWALTGPARRGYPANRYSLSRGIEYMRRAWAEKNIKMKDKLFAAAWRSCGETMHLLSDMTVPAHVRNDAHPGYPNGEIYSGMRYDPYEYYVTKNHDSIAGWSKLKVERSLSAKIDTCKDVYSLFHMVALYTNRNFFSADTLTGKNENGRQVRCANGMRPYPSPNLDQCTLDPEGFYVDNRTGFHVAHVDWADNTWWNIRNYLRQTYVPAMASDHFALYSYEDLVIDQAKVLIPIAVKANCKLLEMFIPEVKVNLSNWDEKSKTITGSITHVLSGVYADKNLYPNQRPLLFNKAGGRGKSWSDITINKQRYSEVVGDYILKIDDNKIKIILGEKIKLKSGDINLAQLNLFFGGFWVASNDIKLIVSDSMRPPLASPPDTDFNEKLNVTLSSPDGGSIIYRVNGGALKIYSAPINLTETSTIEAYADRDPYSKNSVSSKSVAFKYTKATKNKASGCWALAKVIPINGCSFYKHECYTVRCSGGSGSWTVHRSKSSCSKHGPKAEAGSGSYSVPPGTLIPGETIKLTTTASGANGYQTSIGARFYNVAKGISFDKKGCANRRAAWSQTIARANTSFKGSIPPENNFVVPNDLDEGGLLVIEASGTGGSFQTSMINLYLYKWKK